MKTVHNGVQYGMTAAVAEGLSIIRHADAGLRRRTVDAETAPLRDPDAYRYEIDVAEAAEAWRRCSVVSSWLVGLSEFAGRAEKKERPMASDSRSGSAAQRGPVPGNHVVVIFGATDDLARRKLLPGLFHLANAGLLPARYRIIGSAPAADALDGGGFRKHAREAVAEFGRAKPEGLRGGRSNRPCPSALRTPAPPAHWRQPHATPSRRSAGTHSGCSTWPCRRMPSPPSWTSSAPPA